MALVSLAQARAHCRVESDYPVDQLQAYIDGAVDAAQAYLNRTVYEAPEALSGARAGYAAAVAAAAQARADAREAASAIEDDAERCAALRLAEVEFDEAMAAAERCIHGIVVNKSILSAILLLLGHLFQNRSAVVTGTISSEANLGALELLRPYRRVMMP